MYLYFDRYGTLKEQITFNPARVGNSNVNKIFVYWEGVEEFPDWAQELALQTRYLLQDNTQYPSATTFGFSAQPETTELPFDKNQDLKYFKYYKEYKFLTIDIPDEVLSYNGAVKSYIWVLNADKKRILGLGVFAFMVDGDINEVVPDENISLAQWNMISAQLGLLSGSVIDVTCDIETNTLKVYYANGLTAIRNLPPNGAQTTISSDFLREMIFSADTWVQDGENGYYIYFRAETVGYTDNRFFVQLERDGEYNSDYYNKTGSFVLSDNIFKGSDGSVLLYSNEPYSGRLLVVGGKLLSGDSLVTGLTYNDVNSQLSYKTADGITHSIYLGINEKFDKSNITQTTGDSTVKVMSQKAVTDELDGLKNDLDDLGNNKVNLSYGWINGNVDSTGTYTADTPTRIISEYVLTSNKVINISVVSGYEFVRRYFDSSDNYVGGDTSWQSGSISFSAEYAKMRVVLRKSDNSNITPNESSNIDIYRIFVKDFGDLSNKVWLTLGDSITARGLYQDLVKSLCDIQYVNYGIGGTCIAKTWDSTTNAFCQRYVDMQDDCDLITVWGGVNDFSSNIPIGTKGSTNQRQFYGALKVLIEGLIAKYPAKKIGFILTPTVNYTDTSLNYCFEETNTAGHKLIDYINAIIDMCNDYALPVLDLYHNCGINQLNMSTMTSNVGQTAPDGLHPSILAMNFMKYQILDFIKTKMLM